MSKRFLLTLLMIVVIFGATGVAIFLAKGYTFSPAEKRIIGTGIISVSSEPSSASVFVDGHLTTATDATISSLPPKKYQVRVVKEGFIPWEREVEVKEGLVSEVDVRLFPALPTIYPLTNTGIANPVLSPDEAKLVFIVPSGKKAGVWVWTMVNDQPIAFARSSEPRQIALTNSEIDFAQAQFRWSPDSTQVIATVGNNNYLLDVDRLNNEPIDITPTLTATLQSWDEDLATTEQTLIDNIKDVSVRRIASSSAQLKWSPDETKFMYFTNQADQPKPVDKVATKSAALAQTQEPEVLRKAKVYDIETKQEYELPEAKIHFWLSDSKHVVLVGEGEVSIVDYDGTNKAVIYAGNFMNGFVFAWPDSSRLVLMTTFPTPTASEPNLYGINLK